MLSTDGGRASNEPEAIDPEPGLGQSPNEPEALRKTLAKNNTLPKIDSDSSDSSLPPVGRWRRSIPKSWKKKAVPQVDLEYSYDATSDVHYFNPNSDGVTEIVDGSVRSTLVVKSMNGIVTIPINGSLVESKNIFELHNAKTQTDELEVHGLTELFEIIVDENIITQTAASGIPVITESGEAPPPADDDRWAEIRRSLR